MGSRSYLYSNHAVKQMFQRDISTMDVEQVVENGRVIREYPDDQPYPSRLILGWIGNRPIHVVCSDDDSENLTIIITAYEPSSDIWNDDFTTKKN